VNFVADSQLKDEEKRVYEFVVRRFLACCSEDAKGELTTVDIEYGPEVFHASGLIVLQRNYLDVYPYDKWESSQQLPQYTVGETFIPTEANMTEGKTSPPGYLTEPELIALMDANGIGTDATMAEHIAKIKERNYVQTRKRSGTTTAGATEGDCEATEHAERGGRGRGRGRGRGGTNAATTGSRGARGSVDEFIPTTLGVALIEGYENLEFETSLSKPFLRKEVRVPVPDLRAVRSPLGQNTHVEQMEIQMKAICDGTRTRNDVVQQNLEQYRAVFARTTQQMDVLRAVSVS
jgi:DNA topoisomerase-3